MRSGFEKMSAGKQPEGAGKAGDGPRKVISGSFWTSRQRGANSLHEISYRACFKPQLPEYFISRYTRPGHLVLDPFAGRGTTALVSALLGRFAISNDANPLSRVFTEPRLKIPDLDEVVSRIKTIELDETMVSDLDMSMFFHPRTEGEITSLRMYLNMRKSMNEEDDADRWIRMVATSRLTGHSSGFFSVYTLPPNQAVSQEEQERINRRLRQSPEYRDVRRLIIRKSRRLFRDLTPAMIKSLREIAAGSRLLENDSRKLDISDSCVDMTVTSPPFLNIVSYAKDNWMRLWFNSMDRKRIEPRITVLSSITQWTGFISETFAELHRVTRPGGFVAFEVGDTRDASLDEIVFEAGSSVGLVHENTYINVQKFTKTSNIWGVSNNTKGTNTNRIVLFRKPAR